MEEENERQDNNVCSVHAIRIISEQLQMFWTRVSLICTGQIFWDLQVKALQEQHNHPLGPQGSCLFNEKVHIIYTQLSSTNIIPFNLLQHKSTLKEQKGSKHVEIMQALSVRTNLCSEPTVFPSVHLTRPDNTEAFWACLLVGRERVAIFMCHFWQNTQIKIWLGGVGHLIFLICFINLSYQQH